MGNGPIAGEAGVSASVINAVADYKKTFPITNDLPFGITPSTSEGNAMLVHPRGFPHAAIQASADAHATISEDKKKMKHEHDM